MKPTRDRPADGLVDIVDDSADLAPPAAAAGERPWLVLIVDDDVEVHRATTFALAGLTVKGRAITFLHAAREDEARALLRKHDDIAVILLDVVMEARDSGLRLVRFVREDLGRPAPRIVLHTGQPGYAPELQVIQDYDINDYRMKSELTRSRLAVTIVAAIRAYDQLRAIEAARTHLETMLSGAAELFVWKGFEAFCAELLDHGCRLVGGGAEGFVCAPDASDAAHAGFGETGLRVVAASRRFRAMQGQALALAAEDHVAGPVERARARSASEYGADCAALFIRDRAGAFLVLYLEAAEASPWPYPAMLDLFCANASVAFENGRLFERLRSVAYVDALTGLPNRAGFVARVDERIAAGRAGAVVGILDVHQFSEINDALGHACGDQLLKAVAARLADALRGDAVIGRVAGDAFGVLGTEDKVDPERLLGLFARPFRAGPHRPQVTASIGLVRLKETHGGGIDAVKDASIGLERAKTRRHGDYCYFTHAMEAETKARMGLALDLRRALRLRQLQLYYQPQIDLGSGRPVGAEALLRWRKEDGTFIPPAQFIPVAESSGLIGPIGAWVLRTAARQLNEWSTRFGGNFRLSINASAEQFRAPRFGETVRMALETAKADPHRFELEITESLFLEDTTTLLGTLRALKELGVSIAIDDFGIGYSSFGYLHRLPVDRLKIDRTFVAMLGDAAADADAGGGDASIPAMIVRLGHGMGLKVVAEGVETEAQAGRLREAGCEEAQGFLYCRPLPADEFERWFAAHGNAVPPSDR